MSSIIVEIEPKTNDCFSEYSNEQLLDYALKLELISDKSQIDNFSIGHFTGYEAIRSFIRCKSSKQFQCLSKNTDPSNFFGILSNLKLGIYDGKSISDIISDEKRNLGESFIILDLITQCGDMIFSFDKKYSQPYYNKKSNIDDLDEDEKIKLVQRWSENKFTMRKRVDFINHIKDIVCEQKYDAAIKYLVHEHAGGYY